MAEQTSPEEPQADGRAAAPQPPSGVRGAVATTGHRPGGRSRPVPRVRLHGRDVTELPARERGVGVIFQSYALFPRMTVEQNVGYGLRIRGASRGA